MLNISKIYAATTYWFLLKAGSILVTDEQIILKF